MKKLVTVFVLACAFSTSAFAQGSHQVQNEALEQVLTSVKVDKDKCLTELKNYAWSSSSLMDSSAICLIGGGINDFVSQSIIFRQNVSITASTMIGIVDSKIAPIHTSEGLALKITLQKASVIENQVVAVAAQVLRAFEKDIEFQVIYTRIKD